MLSIYSVYIFSENGRSLRGFAEKTHPNFFRNCPFLATKFFTEVSLFLKKIDVFPARFLRNFVGYAIFAGREAAVRKILRCLPIMTPNFTLPKGFFSTNPLLLHWKLGSVANLHLGEKKAWVCHRAKIVQLQSEFNLRNIWRKKLLLAWGNRYR